MPAASRTSKEKWPATLCRRGRSLRRSLLQKNGCPWNPEQRRRHEGDEIGQSHTAPLRIALHESHSRQHGGKTEHGSNGIGTHDEEQEEEIASACRSPAGRHKKGDGDQHLDDERPNSHREGEITNDRIAGKKYRLELTGRAHQRLPCHLVELARSVV